MQFQNKKTLTLQQQESLLNVLKNRFDKNFHRHKEAEWPKLLTKLENSPAKLWSLNAIEETGGEPDVISYDSQTNLFIFATAQPKAPKDGAAFATTKRLLKTERNINRNIAQ